MLQEQYEGNFPSLKWVYKISIMDHYLPSKTFVFFFFSLRENSHQLHKDVKHSITVIAAAWEASSHWCVVTNSSSLTEELWCSLNAQQSWRLVVLLFLEMSFWSLLDFTICGSLLIMAFPFSCSQTSPEACLLSIRVCRRRERSPCLWLVVSFQMLFSFVLIYTLCCAEQVHGGSSWWWFWTDSVGIIR